VDAGERRQGRRDVDDALVVLLATGSTYKLAAEQVGCSESTVRRRMADVQFRHRVNEERGQLVETIRGQLLDAAPGSLKALREIVEDEDEDSKVRVSAASKVLDLAIVRRGALGQVDLGVFEKFAHATLAATLDFVPEDRRHHALSEIEAQWRKAAW